MSQQIILACAKSVQCLDVDWNVIAILEPLISQVMTGAGAGGGDHGNSYGSLLSSS